LSAEFRPAEHWRLTAAYRYLDVKLHAQPGSTDVTSVNSEAHDPDHIVLLRSSLDLLEHFQIDATFRYADRIGTHRVPAYEEVDLRVAWQPNRTWEVSVTGQNLLHDHHAEFRPAPTRHLIERSVFGKIAVNW
jgi:iron complex outermembrane receptor protein